MGCDAEIEIRYRRAIPTLNVQKRNDDGVMVALWTTTYRYTTSFAINGLTGFKQNAQHQSTHNLNINKNILKYNLQLHQCGTYANIFGARQHVILNITYPSLKRVWTLFPCLTA